jgi:hypothetical protein
LWLIDTAAVWHVEDVLDSEIIGERPISGCLVWFSGMVMPVILTDVPYTPRLKL